MSGSFVGENATIPVKQDEYRSNTFNRHKMAVICTMSNELLKVTSRIIQDYVQVSILEDTATAIDARFLSDEPPIPNVAPAGILNGAATTTSVGLEAALLWVLQQLGGARAQRPAILIGTAEYLELQMMRESGVYLYRDELARTGGIFGVPVISSANVPAGQVIGLVGERIVIGMAEPEVDLSASATVVMVNDDGVAPTMAETGAVTEPGSVKVSDAAGTTPAAEVHSVFQMDATAMRFVLPISWGQITDTCSFVATVTP